MRFQLLISCNNAAFSGVGLWREPARILHELATRLENEETLTSNVRDHNGNTVGNWAFIDDLHTQMGEKV